jgi:hypothetical protein
MVVLAVMSCSAIDWHYVVLLSSSGCYPTLQMEAAGS